MSRPRTVSRRPRVDPVRAALVRLAEAHEEGELRALAQAQRRTEERIEQLALAVQTLGRLGDTIGYGIEDLARDLTPDRLAGVTGSLS